MGRKCVKYDSAGNNVATESGTVASPKKLASRLASTPVKEHLDSPGVTGHWRGHHRIASHRGRGAGIGLGGAGLLAILAWVARAGRGPVLGLTIEFEETDAGRTRAWPFLPGGGGIRLGGM
eukprot:gene11710-biopygen3377